MERKEIPLGRRNQVTLPKNYIPPGVKFFVCERADNGSIILTPEITVPITQSYFWSRRWQVGEQEASADISAGRVTRHKTAQDLIASLKKRRSARK